MSDAIEKLFSVSRLKSKWEETAPKVQENVEEVAVEEVKYETVLELWRSCLESLREEFPKADFSSQIEILNSRVKRFEESQFKSAEKRQEICEELRSLEASLDDWILANRIA